MMLSQAKLKWHKKLNLANFGWLGFLIFRGNMSLYTVDTANKKLKPLDGTKLSEQQLTERYDLQEWLVSHPEALGEELLIIQKEFDGFDGTGERLDLLALDTKGQLVLIENKRDDSGRDAVWQALKYALCCAVYGRRYY
jgi:RecB family endonuclease NucS